MGIRRLALVALVLALAVGAVAYAGASWLLFDRVSRVDAACGFFADGSPRFGDFTPASFWMAGIREETIPAGFDVAGYLMPAYEELDLRSRDGIDLAAWWVPAARADAPAVIVVHGRGGCRREPLTLLPAGMLHRHGFAVLLLDLREHGDSQVLDGRYAGGTQEYLDVLGAWDWLRERGLAAERIGLLGQSNGASTVVIAAGEEPGIAAVWEDSGYADTTAAIDEEVRHAGFPDALTAGGKVWGRLYGIDLDAHRPIDAVAAIGGRPLQGVHGLSDDRVQPHHAIDFVRAREAVVAPDDPFLTPWFVPLAEHIQSVIVVPDEYERRLVAFFRDALGEPAS